MAKETASFEWEGKVTSKVNGVTAEKIWSAFSDFCNVHEWYPVVDTCHRVEGIDYEPGLIRYCASAKTKEKEVMWAKERLVKIDPIERCLSYEILENNAGFRSYVATIKVMSMENEDQVCVIEWSFVSDPVDGWKKEDLESYIDFCLRDMVKKMETNL